MAVVLLLMRLDLTARFADGVLNLTLRRVESILDRDYDMLVLRGAVAGAVGI